MGKIIFHGSGFGDFFVCFKALFAIKQLYPQHQLIAYHSGIEPAFMQKVGFIDELISQNDKNLTQIRALEPDIFISAQRSGKFFKELERLNFKKNHRPTPFHQHYTQSFYYAFALFSGQNVYGRY